ncbi:MAG: GTP-binding protein, partial [Selenomonadaceae bacterium]|nr:GTP-binding protein [Selenomonadaceae bacterium]
RILKDGLKTAIIGRPNVGKSSLLNALMKEERAIVSDIPGTTRDSIEAEVNIMGVPVILVDTAGIRDANDEIEHIGVDIAKERAKNAELILAVFDSSSVLTAEDREIFSLLKNKDAIFVLNKIDIAEGNKEIKAEILAEFPTSKITEISAKRLIGFDALKKEIANFAEMREDMPSYIINNERVYNSLLKAKKSLEDAINSQKSGLSEDYIVIDLREALSSLGEITGETLDDDIINRIFEDFCIGK